MRPHGGIAVPISVKNFKLTLEYDGTGFCGWQVQKKGVSVQGLLQNALKRITGEKIHVIGSGRTDAGVHALGQIAHFKTSRGFSPEKIQSALNGLLPDAVAVKSVEEAPLEFHAQLSAKSKLYAYLILNGPIPSAFLRPFSWQIKNPLDWDAVHRALELFVGEHDFKSFQSAGTIVKSTVRKIYCVGVQERYRDHPNLYAIQIEANGFLKQMVRNIIGTVVQVGQGRLTVEEIKKIFAAKDRRKAGPAAPAKGLFLVEVRY
jgi:tRNA pseudouridine38-40 synthase